MTNEPTKQTLAQLGVNSPEKIPALFAEVRAEFDRELSSATDDANWKSVRDAWLGRKSGVLSQITDNWLKPAPPELKRVVGQELNKLKAHVEAALAERQAAIEAAGRKSGAGARANRSFASRHRARDRHAPPDPPNLRRAAAHFPLHRVQRGAKGRRSKRLTTISRR